MRDRLPDAPPSGLQVDANVAVCEPVPVTVPARTPGLGTRILVRLRRLARLAYDLLTQSP
jgi:hypothetical protein